MMKSNLLMMMFPIVLLIVFTEAAILWRRAGASYDWRESLASIGVAIGHNISGVLLSGPAALGLSWLWEHRLTTIPLNTAGGIIGLFFGLEFFYYWFHRASHEIRWFWTPHAVHHSPNQLNLSASYRLGWTSAFTGSVIFFAPLVWIGFAPQAVFTALALNLLYQFWLHTELVPKLGWFEWMFNTPSHHRVHHASQPEYLDKNYGGVLIIFDRLFGTFAEEREDLPCQYGLVKPIHSYNPFVIAFHETIAMLRDVKNSRNIREALGYLFGRPGWRPDGQGLTTQELQARKQPGVAMVKG